MDIHIATEKEKALAFKLRFEVFVKEQNVPPELELDTEDDIALHIVALENGELLGCARVIFSDDEKRGKNAHIGRLAVKKEHRKKGIGADICRFIIARCLENGYKNIWLNSQLHAVGFYERLGFIPVGEMFYDAGIEHFEMILDNKGMD